MAKATPLWKRRWLVFSAGALVLLVVAVAVALPLLLDVERYRPRIEQALRDATGWEPELGPIELSLFPRPALHVGPSRLASPVTESAIALDALDVAAEFWPLLRGTLAIEDITLDRPQVTLLREAADASWDLPAPQGGDAAAGQGTGGRSLFDVTVRRLRLRAGAVRLEDRSIEPPRLLALDPFSMTVEPQDGTFDGSARLAPDGGELRWQGTFAEGLTLTLENLSTGRLGAIVGSDLLHPAGVLSGTIEVSLPLAVDGQLSGRNLGLSTGEHPLEGADLEFRVVADDAGLELETTRLTSGGLALEGGGSLTPALDLAFRVPDAPLEAALTVLRALFPFPLDLRGPGTANAGIVVRQRDDAAIVYAASGSLTAARFVGAAFLPSADDLKARFDLTEQGRLTIDIIEGQVAGGPVRGQAVLDRVDPPGTLRFDGTLRDASMGGLLAGFVERAAEKIVGPTAVEAALTLDLGREVVDASALGGALTLSSGQITLPGWDVEGKIESELATRLSKLNLQSFLDQKQTTQLGTSDVPVAFDGMRADLRLDALPWRLDDLRLTRDGGALTGGGSFDPLRGTIALDLQVALSDGKSAKLVEKYRSLAALRDADGRIRLPLGLKGAIDQPGFEVDLGGLALEALGKEDVRKELGDKLKKLFDDDDD